MSDRQVAEAVGVSHHTVAAKRVEMEAGGQIAQLDTSTGADGKEYPRREAPTKKARAEKAQPFSRSAAPLALTRAT